MPVLDSLLRRFDGAARVAEEPERFDARTRDGYRLAMYHYAARGDGPRHHPVLLVHGLGSNRFDVDYPGEQNLARFCRDAGYDTWIVELRGAGNSTPATLFDILTRTWAFDDYVFHDCPAAVQFVREKTGARALHWIGHSLGGMLAYPFLVTCDPGLVRSCVAIGGPSMTQMASPIHDFLYRLKPLLRLTPVLLYGTAGRLASRLIPYIPAIESVAGQFLYNPENMDIKDLQRLSQIALHNLPSSLVLQAYEWYDTKHFRSYYETFSFRENLHRIDTPMMIVAGAVDRLTPPEDLRFVYDRISSKEKEFLVVGKQSGAATDYGHVDLVLGRNAKRDVYPHIKSWLDRHD